MREKERRQLYESWVREHSQELYAFAFRRCGDAAQAEDLVQETFYEAWKSMRTLRDKNKARAWLYRIARRRYSHWLGEAGRRNQANVSLSRVPEAQSDRRDNVVNLVPDRELLQKALDSLDDRSKELFLMVYLEGMTCREAAEELGIPLGTALSRIHRARETLRSELRRLDPKTESDSNGRNGNESDNRHSRGGV